MDKDRIEFEHTPDGLLIRLIINDNELGARIANIPESDIPQFIAYFQDEFRRRLLVALEEKNNPSK